MITDAQRGRFESMLDGIESYARIKLRKTSDREHLILDVIATSWEEWIRACDKGVDDKVTTGTLAYYSVRMVLDRKYRSVDALSHTEDTQEESERKPVYCRGRRRDCDTQVQFGTLASWKDCLIVDSRYRPDEYAIPKIDFEAYFASLTSTLQTTAIEYASGNDTKTIAKKLGVSPGRISQQRQRLRSTWNRYVSH